MPNVVMRSKNIPAFEFYINNWKEGKFKHTIDSQTEYCLNFPNGNTWSIGAGDVMTPEDIFDEPVNIYRLKSDRDFQIASDNMLNSQWCWTDYKKIPIVKEGLNVRDVYVLHYRHYPQVYDLGLTKDTQTLFNVAIRFDEDPSINNWLIYCESDKNWYDFNPTVKNVKNEVIGWVKTPCKINMKEVTLAE